MNRIIILVALFISIGVAAQEKFQINADMGALLFGKNNFGYSLSAAYNFNSIGSVGLEGMFSNKTSEYGLIQKYTAFVDVFAEKNKDFGLSFGVGFSYLHSPNVLNNFGMDFRSRMYMYLFSNTYLTVGIENTIAKQINCLPQLKVGLMYRF